MNTFMLIRTAIRAILHHAIRSSLTLLGIIIGIAGIIVISALGKGTQQKARSQFLAYGAKSIQLSAGNFMAVKKKPPRELVIGDAQIIRAQCPHVQYISPQQYLQQIPVEYGGESSTAQVIGTGEHAPLIHNETIQTGVFFNQQHIQGKDNVAVLSPEIAELFFKSNNPVGELLRINKVPYTIIGVFAPKKIKGKWDGISRPKIIIPYTTHQKHFGNKIHEFAMGTYTEDQIAETVRQLEKIFRAAHSLQEDEPNDFMIFDNQTFAAAAEEAAKSVGIFALIAAIIALIVGGIGVMNIMLVAVQERTKEIGIKVALGATKHNIRMQFLIEAVVICLIGGIVGVISGITIAEVLHFWFGQAAVVEPLPVFTSFFFTALIGLLFGFYPAERAARLNPIEALKES